MNRSCTAGRLPSEALLSVSFVTLQSLARISILRETDFGIWPVLVAVSELFSN